MWEYQIMHKVTKEVTVIFGYSLSNAFQRYPTLNPDDWDCLSSDYID